jgi:two-component system, NarL family, nitrate/nitrite response regulator NarL
MHRDMPERPTGPPTIGIALVDDDQRAREILVDLLEATPGLRVVGHWGTVEPLLRHDRARAPDLLLLDIQLPGMSGIEALEPLCQRFPDMTVLMLTVFEDEDKVFQALCRGAHGYLLKDTAPDRLIDYVREANAGGSPMSPEIARTAVTLFRTLAPATPAEPGLSPQQVRLLALLADGHSYQSAAREMEISVNTVRGYIRIIYDKLHVHSRSAAVAQALRSGLI